MTTILPFSQSWLTEPETSFQPGSAEIIFSEGQLYLSAKLIQSQLRTQATNHQQRLWELGDVVELFVQNFGDSGYHEYQIAPNGKMLALYYPDPEAVAAVRSGVRHMEEFLSDLPLGTTRITPSDWEATLIIPMQEGRLLLNCGRYDYSSGSTPVISSTSPLTRRDFHQITNWTEFHAA